ncbi:MAG: hypothetical protein HC822_25965 [Oscillochloris sp.]|nr:hypothetical protein [Oscillochloris sp.]
MVRGLLLLVILLVLAGCSRQGTPIVAAAPLEAPEVAQRSIATAPVIPTQSWPTQTPLPTNTVAPVTQTPLPPTATPGPPPLRGGEAAPPLSGELAMVTYSLDLYRLDGAPPAAVVQQLGLDGEAAIENGSRLIGGTLSGRVAVRFEPPQSGECAIRGITRSDLRTIRLFYAPDTDPNRMRGILAHELFHQIQRDYYGERDHRKADVILLEGMAVWGTADYFRAEDGRALYQVRAKAAFDEGRLLPLTTSLEADCRTTTRNDIYNQWASFVEYLLATYDRDALDVAYRSSSGRPAGSADWVAAYGKPLPVLEQEWITWLGQQ